MRPGVLLTAALLVALSATQASAWSCSDQRKACAAAMSSRGATRERIAQVCDGGYPACMRTGVWDTSGLGQGGVRKTNLERR